MQAASSRLGLDAAKPHGNPLGVESRENCQGSGKGRIAHLMGAAQPERNGYAPLRGPQ